MKKLPIFLAQFALIYGAIAQDKEDDFVYSFTYKGTMYEGINDTKNKIKIPEKYKWNLCLAIEAGDANLVEILLDEGEKDSNGLRLEQAINKGRDDIVEKFLSNKVTDPYGWALAAAIRKGRDDVVEKLFTLEVSKDPEGRALAAAIEAGNDFLVDKLLARGSIDRLGFAREAARDKERYDIIELLYRYKAQQKWSSRKSRFFL